MSLANSFSVRARRRAVIAVACVVGGFVLLTALFAVVGWFQDAAPQDPEETAVGEPFRIGDFEYVVTGAHLAADPEGVYLPRDDDGEIDPDVRGLIVELEVTNVGDRPWLAVNAGGVVHSPADGGIVPDANDSTDRAPLFSKDGHLVSVLNPGVTVIGSYGWAQDAAWTGDEVTVEFTDLRWVEDDPLTLDDQHWADTDRTIRTVTVPVSATVEPAS